MLRRFCQQTCNQSLLLDVVRARLAVFEAGTSCTSRLSTGSRHNFFGTEASNSGAAAAQDPASQEPADKSAAAEACTDSEEVASLDVDELKATLTERAAQLEESRQELAVMKDRAIRVMADMENLRVRTAQQVEEARTYANQGFAKSVLDVADNIERALSSVPEDLRGPGEISKQVTKDALAKTLVSFYNGVALSEKVMLKIFRDNGLERIEAKVGGDFNPNLHNAMFELPTSEHEPGRIAAIVKAGYTLKGRVIRAADVGVAKALDS